MAKTKIVKCDACRPHDFQDKTYGNKMRVHNVCKDGTGGSTDGVCTVCGNKKNISGGK